MVTHLLALASQSPVGQEVRARGALIYRQRRNQVSLLLLLLLLRLLLRSWMLRLPPALVLSG
jgi:hypothetical protein